MKQFKTVSEMLEIFSHEIQLKTTEIESFEERKEKLQQIQFEISQIENFKSIGNHEDEITQVLLACERILESLKNLNDSNQIKSTNEDLEDHQTAVIRVERLKKKIQNFENLKDIFVTLSKCKESVESRPAFGLEDVKIKEEILEHKSILVPNCQNEIEKAEALLKEIQSQVESNQISDEASKICSIIKIISTEFSKREEYLEMNKNLRIDYEALKMDLLTLMVEEKKKLALFEDGISFELLESSLEEFENLEARLMDLWIKIDEVRLSLKPLLKDQSFVDELAQEADLENQVSCTKTIRFCSLLVVL